MDGDDLHILAFVASVQLFVLDAEVREMHLLIEVREIVFACPLFDFALVAIGMSVVVVAIAIVLVEPPLVVALSS
jgi:hypothetical protein